jgi:heptosyltransferase I
VKGALIVRLGSLGDVVHAIPAAAALREAFPLARIDWVTHPSYLPLLELVPAVDNRIGIDTRQLVPSGNGNDGRPYDVLTVLRILRRAAYDVVLDLQGLIKSAALARLVGASRTIGFPREHLREPLARLFYTEAADPGAASHVIHKNLGLLGVLGVSHPPVAFPLRIPPSAAADEVALAHARGFALINPGAAWPNKRWPAARFGALAQALRERHGLSSVVLWGPGEEPLAREVVAGAGGAATLAPATTIADLFAIAREARVMISGDTGPLHIAAAVGTPVVALFGPTRADRNGPWNTGDLSISRVHQCECLYQRTCRRPIPCIDDIAIGEVLHAVEQRLA